LSVACERIVQHRADALVVSLGVDTFERDPISCFKLETRDYLRVGERVAALGLPTLFVLEGGYALDEIAENVTNVLIGAHR
jgi:acetoin utilization deacetylase AcuC-like enzyme